mmetsp:Transcript_36119/g.69266  ORF Transcript_36119/g.69266 Transcript_36119/m.69266 type:complete len:277 (+) Transcript_36119:240-1070(+)
MAAMHKLERSLGRSVGIPGQHGEGGTWGTLRSLGSEDSEGSYCSQQFTQVDRRVHTTAPASSLAITSKTPSAPAREKTGPVFGGQPLPKVFTFHTWWTESGKRQTMVMDYFTDTRLWRVKVDVPLPVHIYRRDGQLLEPHDLHVGARVDVLGRTVTLRQASLDARNWLDDQARALLRRKLALEAEVAKFAHVRFTHTQHLLPHDNGTALNPIHALGGKLNLRGLQQEVAALRETLSHYRPNVVVGDARDGEGDADKREHSDTNTHVNEDGNADVNI